MPVTRRYLCDCGAEFTKFHMSRDEPAPECPVCSGETISIPGTFSIKGNASRALDMAQHIAETEHGLTDMKDGLRPGDISAPDIAVMQTAERDALQRQINDMAASANVEAPLNPMVQSAWGDNGSGGANIPIDFATTSADTRSKGLDAVSLAEKAPAGGGPAGMRLRVIAGDRV